MLLECLHVLQRLRQASPPVAIRHTAEGASDAAPPVTEKLAFDIDASRSLLLRPWSPTQLVLLRQHFDPELEVLEPAGWLAALRVLLDHYEPASTDWQEIAFRLWARRVLAHTTAIAGVPYDEAMRHLQEMVRLAAST
jgi:hypothetical protein